MPTSLFFDGPIGFAMAMQTFFFLGLFGLFVGIPLLLNRRNRDVAHNKAEIDSSAEQIENDLER